MLGDWNTQNAKLNFYEGVIWYKKEFILSAAMERRYILHLGAANYKAEVYLNGDSIGVHERGFTSFQFDITEKVITRRRSRSVLSKVKLLLITKKNNETCSVQDETARGKDSGV